MPLRHLKPRHLTSDELRHAFYRAAKDSDVPADIPPWAIKLAVATSREVIREFCRLNGIEDDCTQAVE